MKRIINKLRKGPGSGGFTMIELLVVIAVIGVLAVAVLGSINPIEQINKGRDTRVRTNAGQMLNALDRFYAIQEIYPWNDATYNGEATDTLPGIAIPDATVCTDNGDGFCQIGGVYEATGLDFDGGATETPPTGDAIWLSGLSSTDEVKDSFITAIENPRATNALYIAKVLDGDVYVCFLPSSNAFQLEAVTSCVERSSDLPNGACPSGPYDATSTYTDELICLP